MSNFAFNSYDVITSEALVGLVVAMTGVLVMKKAKHVGQLDDMLSFI